MKRERFAPHGHLALRPQAFGATFDMPDAPATSNRDGIAIVDVRGPLMHHESWCFDSYDAIKARVIGAVETSPRAVVLSIDSPGGLVSGCFDTATEIKALCERAGVPLYAYVDGQATSAAYALACAASSITTPSTGILGSIGVIDMLAETTAMDAAMGVRFQVIASGARKSDGNPHVPISDAAIATAQSRVDALAEIFFAHVATNRPINTDEVRALQASLVHGQSAVDQGLADQVGTLDELLSMIASGTMAETKEQTMPTNYEESVAGLREAAKGDDENAKMAKKMLAAMDEKEEPDAEGQEPDGDEPKKDEKEEPAAEGDDHKEPDGDEAKKATAIASKALAMVTSEKRARVFASRPDLTDEQKKHLASVPTESLEATLRAIPRAPKSAAAAAASAIGTRGEGQGAESGRLPATEGDALKIRMGLVRHEATVRNDGNILILGEMTPAGKPVK